MAPFTKPETVLKQAEGLISVGQTHAALQSLTEMFSSKRFRSTPLSSLEPIMIRFVELCVDMRKGRTAKEGLMQYKNIAQNTSVGSIEVVIKKFVSLADQKVKEAQEKADRAVALVDIDDLEASETPESILLGAVSGDQNKDRTDRALVTPWLKFLWESYRTALETLKNNARLEAIYQQIAHQAFRFCLKHVRKVEFRRLCETLRLHLSNVAKYAHQPHSIDLSDPDTLQHHLDTRFAQLNTSVELELWQEAFRSVEDVHNLLTLAKKAPRPAMMANYYEKLARIFLMSGNGLYHAAAWSRYSAIVRASGSKSAEELGQLAGLVLLSALAVPVIAENEDGAEDGKAKNARLTALLGLTKMPSRAGLLKEALSRNILKLSPKPLRDLYDILEVTFDPLSICESAAPVLKGLTSDPAYAPYVPLLHRVLLSRLFSQLSKVYSSIRISQILDFVAPLNDVDEGKYKYGQEEVEAFIMSSAKSGELAVRVDHADGSITFVDDVFTIPRPVSGETFHASPSAIVRTRLSRLATCLHTSLITLNPPSSPSPAAQFQSLVAAAQAERKALKVKRAIVARRRELLSELSVRKEKEEASRKAEQNRREKEEENKKAAEERRRRDIERARKEIENIRIEEARKLAADLKARGNLKVDIEEIDSLDTTKLVQLQVEQMDKEKRERDERLRIIAKRIDHIERAFRKEERPLLASDYEKQQADDRAAHDTNVKLTLEAARKKHADDLATKKRLSRMMNEYHAHRAAVSGKREEAFKRKREAAQKKIDEEKAKRRAAVLKVREEERKKSEESERIRREKEEEEARKERERQEAEQQRIAQEDAEKAAKEAQEREKAEQLAALRKQRELERQEALEAAKLRAQREEEAEQRRAARALERQKPSPATNAVNGGGTWRRSAATTTATPSRSDNPPPRPQPESQTSAANPRPLSARVAEGGGLAGLRSGSTGGGWRERQQAKEREAASGPRPTTPTQRPATPVNGESRGASSTQAQDDDGFTTVQASAKPRPYRPPIRR